ncbi:MAG TPA: phospholipid carrier-dependent glycosyltransferase [Chthoniobacterales bacterium]|jgi:4-amino-4-deoxy-L-arabinose transferase-like glycosyltransferase
MIEAQPRFGTISLIALALILSLGIFWRIPSAAFTGAPAPLRVVHLNSTMKGLGFDENLYRAYVNVLIARGITSYPDLAEEYVTVQDRLTSAILPPTRFLYIFTAYLWHQIFGADALSSLKAVSSLFSMLLLIAATVFAWRVAGPRVAISVAALMCCAPAQIHMSQHALIDGFFAFWATLSLWLLWENLQHPNNWRWLTAYTLALALMVVTKENALFAYFGLAVLLVANHWLQFGKATRVLWMLTLVGALLGVAVLVNLCGSLHTATRVYALLTSKASALPYAIKTGDGPWYRYLVDLMLMSPVVLVLAIGRLFQLDRTKKPELYMSIFVTATYLVMCNVRYGMNLRYTNMWDLPLRFLAVCCLLGLIARFARWQNLVLAVSVAAICALELNQYYAFFAKFGLYELVTEGLLRAVNILK